MKNSKRKEIIIASDYFLEILGIKTIINTNAVQCNVAEVYNFVDLKNVLKDLKSKQKFVIVTENFISEKNGIDTIIDVCDKCNLMYVCDKIPENNKIKYFILKTNNIKDACNKFTEFLNINDVEKSNKTNNTTTDKSILSDREIEVLKEVASGLSNKEIAEKLFISINTVISHRKKITDKLDIKSISGLTVYALMHDLINPEEVKI